MKTKDFIRFDTGREFFLILGLVFILFSGCETKIPVEGRFYPHRDAQRPPEITEAEAVRYLTDDFFVTPGFSTHLPLLLIDTDQEELLVFDADSANDPFGPPSANIAILIHVRENSRTPDPKGVFAITLVDGQGEEREIPLLKMPSNSQWLLAGSVQDKSLMRKYLSYCLASWFIPETGDIRFCELLLRKNGLLAYQGVYLLSPAGGGLSFSVERELEELREVLYSTDHKTYSRYHDLIDEDSFVNYCLLSEFFLNDNEGSGLPCFYLDSKGKLRIAPVWDGDRILGNYLSGFPDPLTITIQKAPIFDKLSADLPFLNRLSKRYSQLRREVLEDNAIIRVIDDTAAYLGPAQTRDWKRWAREYQRADMEKVSSSPLPEPDPEGVTLRENTVSFEQELIRIKYLILRHSGVIGNSIHRISWREDLFDSSYNSRWSFLFIILYILLYLFLVYFGRRHQN